MRVRKARLSVLPGALLGGLLLAISLPGVAVAQPTDPKAAAASNPQPTAVAPIETAVSEAPAVTAAQAAAVAPEAPAPVAPAAAAVAPKAEHPPAKSVALTPEARQLARSRFNRGLELYDAADYFGALREFQGALEIMRHPVVLYNVALVYAQVGSPVKCTEIVDELQQGGIQQLDTTSRQHLLRVYDEQRLRIGRLRVRANVPGALIQLDGEDVGQSGLEDLAVASGEHIVAIVASGYIPRRMRVTVPPSQAQEVTFNLQPLQSTLAHLHVRSDVPDVDVNVDGEPAGKTPFPASLAFSPGSHVVKLTRPGYLEETRTVVLDPGGEGHLDFQMRVDPAAAAARGALALKVSEPNSIVTINGRVLGFVQPRLELPIGRHRLLVHSAGFMDYKRDVTLAPGETSVRIELLPTSEFLKDYQNNAWFWRKVGWAGLGAGVVVAGASTGFLVWNESKRQDAKEEFAAFVGQVEETSATGRCPDANCVDQLNRLAERVDDLKGRAVYGWVGLGVGAAAAIGSIVVLLTGDDPDRYEPRRESDVFGKLRLNVLPAVGGGGALLGGTF